LIDCKRKEKSDAWAPAATLDGKKRQLGNVGGNQVIPTKQQKARAKNLIARTFSAEMFFVEISLKRTMNHDFIVF
jgi:hypothetical protein